MTNGVLWHLSWRLYFRLTCRRSGSLSKSRRCNMAAMDNEQVTLLLYAEDAVALTNVSQSQNEATGFELSVFTKSVSHYTAFAAADRRPRKKRPLTRAWRQEHMPNVGTPASKEGGLWRVGQTPAASTCATVYKERHGQRLTCSHLYTETLVDREEHLFAPILVSSGQIASRRDCFLTCGNPLHRPVIGAEYVKQRADIGQRHHGHGVFPHQAITTGRTRKWVCPAVDNRLPETASGTMNNRAAASPNPSPSRIARHVTATGIKVNIRPCSFVFRLKFAFSLLQVCRPRQNSLVLLQTVGHLPLQIKLRSDDEMARRATLTNPAGWQKWCGRENLELDHLPRAYHNMAGERLYPGRVNCAVIVAYERAWWLRCNRYAGQCRAQDRRGIVMADGPCGLTGVLTSLPSRNHSVLHYWRQNDEVPGAGPHSRPTPQAAMTLLLNACAGAVQQWRELPRDVRSPPACLSPRRIGFNPRPVHYGFSQVGIVPDYAAGRWAFSWISRSPYTFIPALLHTHLASPTLALKTSMLRAAQIYSLTITRASAHTFKI
ncbi:hypothetical protein PR048_000626 [Dryococelus australis]|uniref:Uncharacterized protein n=1 Tax=Dryococelus australis TaxID=614101 RepID=A0ABQ9IF71_9NEOP|nr:hypothetical protein PR048_000626 [Dryococelus australis]